MPSVCKLPESVVETCVRNKHHLLFDVAQDTLSLGILNQDKNTLLGFYSYEINTSPSFLTKLDSLLLKLLTKSSNKTMGLTNDIVSIVPSFLYQDSLKGKIVGTGYQLKKEEKILENYLEVEDSWFLFPVVNTVSDFKVFSGAEKINHTSFSVVKTIMTKPEYTKREDVYVGIERTHVSLCIFKNQHLLLCNKYPYRQDEDILYHIINTSNVAGIDTAKANYSFYGSFDTESVLHQLLRKYLKYAFPIQPFTDFKFDEKLSDIKYHTVFRLLSLLSCE